MRGHVDGMPSRHRMGAMLPGVYQTDGFAQRFTAGLDEVIAPVLSTLDNLAAYFDPRTAPEDFLEYLSGWVGIEFEESWSRTRRRDVLLQAVALHRRRGTADGIRDAVALVTRAPVEVVDSGAAAWSQTPVSDIPGDPRPSLVIKIGIDSMSDVDRRRIEALVSAVKPAHVPHRIEMVGAPHADVGPSPQPSPGDTVTSHVATERVDSADEGVAEQPGIDDAGE
jgi:phage tail-like protein